MIRKGNRIRCFFRWEKRKNVTEAARRTVCWHSFNRYLDYYIEEYLIGNSDVKHSYMNSNQTHSRKTVWGYGKFNRQFL